MTQIVPTIIPESFDHIMDQASSVADYVKTIQIDVMDGKYSPKASWPYNRHNNLPADSQINLSKMLRVGLELDMLMHNPEQYIEEWIPFGVQTFIVHFESTNDVSAVFDKIEALEKTPAIALKPSSGADAVEPFLERASFVQVMGSDKVGYNGVSLEDKALECISDLRSRHKELIIGIDIGVNAETAPKIVAAGANRLASGSAVHGAEDKEAAIRQLSIA